MLARTTFCYPDSVFDPVHFGVAFLRTGWVNLDWIWTAALGLCGVVLLVM